MLYENARLALQYFIDLLILNFIIIVVCVNVLFILLCSVCAVICFIENKIVFLN